MLNNNHSHTLILRFMRTTPYVSVKNRHYVGNQFPVSTGIVLVVQPIQIINY